MLKTEFVALVSLKVLSGQSYLYILGFSFEEGGGVTFVDLCK